MNSDMMSGGKAKWITYIPSEIEMFFASEKKIWKTNENSPEQFLPIVNKDGVALFMKRVDIESFTAGTIDVSSLGIFDLWINGRRVGVISDGETTYDELKPGWTDYSKRVFYCSYDITPYLKNGENVILAAVAPGWWNGKISGGTYGRNHVSFIAAIHYLDNKGCHDCYTDESWLGSWGGAVRASDIYDGELYDDNYPCYSEISSNPEVIEWHRIITENRKVPITPYMGPRVIVRKDLDMSPDIITIYQDTIDNGTDYGVINVISEFENLSAFSLKKGQTAVIDIGQNLSGWPEISLSGSKDTTVQIRMGEMLNNSGRIEHGNDGPEGSLYTSNLRKARSKIYCIISDKGHIEKYNPTFTYFGFRYLEIQATDDIDIDDIIIHTVGSDTRDTGSIVTSSNSVNKLISNVVWGQRSNYISVPTDCPQRNERLGWTGDTQAFCGTACYNSDVKTFFEKWLQDMRDSQSDSGAYSDIAPRTDMFGDGSAGWADAGIIVPYILWKMYDDVSAVKKHYPSMERYMEWISYKGFAGPNDTYADWLADEWTERDYMSAVFYVLDAKYMSVLSRAVEREDRVRYYRALYNTLVENFRDKYIDPNGRINEKYLTQTGLLLALRSGVLLDSEKGYAIDDLKRKIIENGYRLSTGFIGTSIINLILAENGENNLAYSLLLQEGLPSWLYAVNMGATTVWERWDSFTEENGFKVYGTDSSFNHYAYGAVLEWIYRYVAGIESTEKHPGFTHPVFQPHPDTRSYDELPDGQENIHWIKCRFDSPVGILKSSWSISETEFRYEFETPVEATLRLPIINDYTFITIDGKLNEISSMRNGLRDNLYVAEFTPGKHEIIQSI